MFIQFINSRVMTKLSIKKKKKEKGRRRKKKKEDKNNISTFEILIYTCSSFLMRINRKFIELYQRSLKKERKKKRKFQFTVLFLVRRPDRIFSRFNQRWKEASSRGELTGRWRRKNMDGHPLDFVHTPAALARLCRSILRWCQLTSASVSH